MVFAQILGEFNSETNQLIMGGHGAHVHNVTHLGKPGISGFVQPANLSAESSCYQSKWRALGPCLSKRSAHH